MPPAALAADDLRASRYPTACSTRRDALSFFMKEVQSILSLLQDDDPVAALVQLDHLQLSNALQILPNVQDPQTALLVLRARCHLCMGSVAAARRCYSAACARDAAMAVRVEMQQLHVLTESWLDHPLRLRQLFPAPPRSAALRSSHNAHVRRIDTTLRTADDSAQLGASAFVPIASNSSLRALLLCFHGNGECADDYAQLSPRLHSLGLLPVVVEMRGYGRSTGEPALTAMLSDVEQFATAGAWQDVSGLGALLIGLPPQLPMLIFGRSIGGHLAIHLTASLLVHCTRAQHSACTSAQLLSPSTRVPSSSHNLNNSVLASYRMAGLPSLKGLLLDSTVASVRHWGSSLVDDDGGESAGRPTVPGGLRTVGLLENQGKMRAIGRTALPVLLLHGAQDSIVPRFQIELLQRCCPHARVTLLDGRGHNDLGCDPLYWEALEKLANDAVRSEHEVKGQRAE